MQVSTLFTYFLDGKYKTLTLEKAKESEEDETVSDGGNIYRAIFYEQKLYIFRKQATDTAQIIDLKDIDKLNDLSPSLPIEKVNFALVETEDPPEEEEAIKPDYVPIMNDKELTYLQKIQSDKDLAVSGALKEKEGKIIDNRKPKLEEESDSDEEKKSERKINFSIKNSTKDKELEQLTAMKNNPVKLSETFKKNLPTIKIVNKSNPTEPAKPKESPLKGPEIKVEKLGDKKDKNKDKKKVRFKESDA